ncbi:MAG: MaoC family dehydratase N-terminal domain-containing protein [Anaerolineae bacterium]
MTNDISLTDWIGNPIEVEDRITVGQANFMNVTLDREPALNEGDILPNAWHWLYFHEAVRISELGVEGHQKLGQFMPPVPLPRRMWAGGSLIFERPIVIGQPAVKRSTIANVVQKSGKSGELYFVTVAHEVSQNGSICLRENQTIVYREAAVTNTVSPTPPAAPKDGSFSAVIEPNPIMLFRYSALTFNGHRIHYDLDFCKSHEGYPNLVFHGPLTATLLLDLFAQQYPNEPIKTFEYRGVSPLFNPDPFKISGKRKGMNGSAWATNPAGGLAMKAQITY